MNKKGYYLESKITTVGERPQTSSKYNQEHKIEKKRVKHLQTTERFPLSELNPHKTFTLCVSTKGGSHIHAAF